MNRTRLNQENFRSSLNVFSDCGKWLLISIFLLCGTVSFGQLLEGTIVNKISGKEIPYVNIGIPAKGIGTVTSEGGKFSLKIEGVTQEARLKISCIGFLSRDISLHDFTESLSAGSRQYYLQPDTLRVAEVVIKPHILESVRVGNTKGSMFKKAGFGPNDDLGREMASFIPVQFENSYIEKVSVKIAQNDYGKIKLRINVYEIQDSLPGKRVNTIPIYFVTDIHKGICEIDLTEYNLRVDRNCFVSIEYIEKMGDSGLYFAFSYNHYPSYWRLTSGSPWVKGVHDNKTVSVNISAIVSHEKIAP